MLAARSSHSSPPCALRLSRTPAAKCRLPAAVVRQLTSLHSLELHGACMDEAAAQAAGCLQQLTRLSFSVQAWDQRQEGEQPAQSSSGDGGPDGSSLGTVGGSAGRRSDGGVKCASGGVAQRWQTHPIWGQLPMLARLQELAVGAELPEPEAVLGGQEDGGGPGGASVLPYDVLDCSVPDGIMDCRCTGLQAAMLPVDAAVGELTVGAASASAMSPTSFTPSQIVCVHLLSCDRLRIPAAALSLAPQVPYAPGAACGADGTAGPGAGPAAAPVGPGPHPQHRRGAAAQLVLQHAGGAS